MIPVAVTPTGARPVALALLARYMERQTLKPALWVIVDDGQEPFDVRTVYTGKVLQITRHPSWQPGQNTQAQNLLAGLYAVEAERLNGAGFIAIIEDDDWYHPDYLSWLAYRFKVDCPALVGEGRSRYYNAATRRHYTNCNTRHASLCATAIAAGEMYQLAEILDTPTPPKFIDLDLWTRIDGRKQVISDRPKPLHVGIKGLPGRAGIGCGHSPDMGKPDPDLAVLREWIGGDAALYEQFTRRREG